MIKFKKLISLISVVALSSSLFIGCQKTEDTNSSTSSNILYLYNWGDYIDPDLKSKFEEETGIKVQEDVYDTNEIMYQKLKSGNSSYDLIIPSDYMIEKMVKDDMIEKIDYSNIPNYKNIDDAFKNLSYDPTNEFSIPYMWGTVGIMYNTTMVLEPVDSFEILWNPKYQRQILMTDSVRDAMGITLKKLGYSLNTTNKDEITKAKLELMKQKESGVVRAYLVDEVKEAMVAEEAALAIVWSGDAITMMERNPNLAYAVPKEGSNKWFDALAIPKGVKHKENAEKFINFLLDPENSKQNTEYIGYSTPNKEAFKLLDEELQENKAAYPDEDILDKCEVFLNLDDKSLKDYYDAWLEIKCK